MDTAQNSSSFSCEISILQAINLEFKSPKNLFVRYYLSAGNNERIRLNTQQQISSKSDFIWNQSFSLECLGTQDSIHALKQSTVVFELRQAKTLPLLGRILGWSRLLGRGEIPWEEVFGSPNMEVAKWACLVREGLGLKQPKLKVGMRVRVNKMEREMKRKRCGKWKDECGCNCKMDYCADHDVFAIAAAMEFL
ncbi:uncharacterized protein LOC111782299 [Cucurbita pepo subsp. pepo]|uniref:uncharacterized protein LOC111782299 n=1 Tax=Cucurbita pepo subsp. pepo TaxID=3664 RepID=UPI000C9D4E85|nr:uncharacterized protein LOC111782299 [Cucurbita pepo subsp. pepo]